MKEKIAELVVDGKKVEFHASSESPLHLALIVFSDMYDYIGSHYTWLSDGVEQTSDKLIHFFKRK